MRAEEAGEFIQAVDRVAERFAQKMIGPVVDLLEANRVQLGEIAEVLAAMPGPEPEPQHSSCVDCGRILPATYPPQHGERCYSCRREEEDIDSAIPIVVDPACPEDMIIAVDPQTLEPKGAIVNLEKPPPGAVACTNCGKKVAQTWAGLCEECYQQPSHQLDHEPPPSPFADWLGFADFGKLSQLSRVDALKTAFEAGRGWATRTEPIE